MIWSALNYTRLTYAASFAGVYILDVFLLSILSHNVTPETYAFYVKILNSLPFLAILVGLGASLSITYYRARGFKTIALFQESNFRAFAVALILALCSFLASTIEPNLVYLVFAVLIAPFIACKQNAVSFWLGSNHLIKASFIRFNQKLIAISFIAIATFAWSLSEFRLGAVLLTGEVIGFGLLLLTGSFTLKRAFFLKGRDKILGIHGFFSNLSSSAAISAPIFLLSVADIPELQFATLSLAVLLTRQVSQLMGPAFQLVMPRVTPMKKDTVRLRSWFKKYVTTFAIISLFVAFVVYLASPIAIELVFDAKYANTVVYMRLLSLGIPALILTSFLGAFTASIGHSYMVSKIAFRYLVILLSTCFITLFIFKDSNLFLQGILFAQYCALADYALGLKNVVGR